MKFCENQITSLVAWLTLTSLSNASLPPTPRLLFPETFGHTRLLPSQEPKSAVTDEEGMQVLNDIRSVLIQSESSGDLINHARKYHVEIQYFDFRTDPLKVFNPGQQFAKNSVASDPTKAKVDLDFLPFHNTVLSFNDKGISRSTVIGIATAAYSSIALHEIAHHEFSVRIKEKFPKMKIMPHCLEHEGIALAREAIFLEEAARKDFKVGSDGKTYTALCKEGAASSLYDDFFNNRAKELLAAARGGRESFEAFVAKCSPKPFSAEVALGQLKHLSATITTLKIEPYQAKNLFNEEERIAIPAAAGEVVKYLEDPGSAAEFSGGLKLLYESELERLGKVFKWAK